MKMANTRHRNENPQTYRALALMWFLIGTSAAPGSYHRKRKNRRPQYERHSRQHLAPSERDNGGRNCREPKYPNEHIVHAGLPPNNVSTLISKYVCRSNVPKSLL